MAKKKTETSASKSETSTRKVAPKKAAGSSSKSASSEKQTKAASKAGKSSKSPAPTAAPMVNMNLAAQAAAQMLAAGLGRREQQQNQPDDEKREGGLIKQLKADLNKGHAQSVSNVLDKGAPQGQKRSTGLPFAQKQVGHNQTFGPDITRSGVPRRTSG